MSIVNDLSHWLLAASALLLLYKTLSARAYPFFSLYLASVAMSALLWSPASPSWWQGFWLYSQPIVLILRSLAVFEWLFWFTLPLRRSTLLSLVFTSACIGLMIVCLTLEITHTSLFRSFISARQYFQMFLFTFVLSCQGCMWIFAEPTDWIFGLERVKKFGLVLSIYLALVFVGSTTGIGGLAWQFLERTDNNWRILDSIVFFGRSACYWVWAWGLHKEAKFAKSAKSAPISSKPSSG